MADSDIPLKEYVDALNEERRRTGNMRSVAIIGTFAAMIYGIQQATKVLASTFENRMNTTNEWRGALEDQAKDKATVGQANQLGKDIEELKKAVAANTERSAGGRLFMGSIVQNITSVSMLIGMAYLIFGGG